MSDSARQLIEYIQKLVSPKDKLPGSSPEWLARGGNHKQHDGPLDPGEGVIWEPTDVSIEDIIEDIAIAGDVLQIPVDELAYYLPFHYFRHRWGIHIRARGIVAIARYLARATQDFGDTITQYEIDLAILLLRQHGAFHHRVELACARYEAPLCVGPLYDAYFLNQKAAIHAHAMASASTLVEVARWQRTKGNPIWADLKLQGHISLWMEMVGGRGFVKWVDGEAFMTGKDVLIDHVRTAFILQAGAPLASVALPPDLIKGRHYFTDGDIDHCPVHLDLEGVGKHLRRSQSSP